VRRSAAIVVRAIDLLDGYKIPRVPASWRVTPECDGWVTLHPDTSRLDLFVHAWLACEASGSGAWVIFGPRAMVDAIVALASRSWASLPDLRADGGPVATQVKAAWAARWGAGTTVPIRAAGYHEDDGEEAGP